MPTIVHWTATAGLIALSFTACSDGVAEEDPTPSCADLYDTSPANPCMTDDTFAFYACSPDEDVTDDACFLACVDPLTDGDTLCYEVEVCIGACSTDDDTGCQNGYNGAPNAACIDYQDYYMAVCDPRGDLSAQACVQDCFETAADCAAFETCLSDCP